MSTHKHFDKICAVIVAFSLVITILFMNGEALGITVMANAMGYESRLFDETRVHTIDIVMDDWESFIDTCENEEYSLCNVIIDGEAYKNVAIRAKGNTSLSTVSTLGSERYSFKIEFDHYDSSKTYYGLDKLCLNNIIQDNTYMKDFLVYQLMEDFGVNAPLCSFVYISVNGEDWGLYLAVEGVEDGFLERNYGSGHGNLYKPDSLSFGGGRGNGKNFDFENFDFGNFDFSDKDVQTGKADISAEMPDGVEMNGGMPQEMPDMGDMNMGMGSDDVKLQYIDDNYDSYSNIFDNAKTDINDADKDRLIASLKALNSCENLEEVLDIEEVLKYFVVHNFVVNGDSYTGSMVHNYYLYEEDGKLSMIPWDYNLAFGTFQGNNATDSVNDPIDSPVSGGSMSDRPMVAWIFENEEYTSKYHEYFEAFIEKYFNSGYLEEFIADTAEMIVPYVEKDPTKFCTYEEFEKGVETIKEFCLLRAESVSGQLEGSIPSTTEGQKADGSALINAGTISLSDMGTMSNGMGGGMTMPDMPGMQDGEMTVPDMSGMQGGEMTMPDMSGMPSGEMTMPDVSDMSGDEKQQGRPSRGDMNFGDSNMPGGADFIMSGAEAKPAEETAQWVLLGASVLVLAAGLVFALRFKR